jgi:hypothetical protein
VNYPKSNQKQASLQDDVPDAQHVVSDSCFRQALLAGQDYHGIISESDLLSWKKS